MIQDLRVGIPVIGGTGWLGGASHIELHVKAVTSLPKHERPQMFLIASDNTLDSYLYYEPYINLFDGIIFHGTKTAEAAKLIGLPFRSCSSWDDLFRMIDFYFPVSFNVLPGRCAASWIHDFQHKHLPDFFSPRDIMLRDALCQKIAEQSHLVFCSSRAVEKDYWRYYPQSKAQTRVIALRVSPEDIWYAGDPLMTQAKYGLPDRFILCSNQFWVHKNHRCLFESIALLRQAGQEVHLVCTGLTSDFRNPEYYEELESCLTEQGIADLVHILGQIPRQDQIQLIRRSLFVVQPSLFEGLSLIVQECRALGKTIVLSDLDVHMEQEYGIIFKRTNSRDLADKIGALLPLSQPGPDSLREIEARLQTAGLAALYAREFCRLTEESQIIFGKSLGAATTQEEKILIATSLQPTTDFSSQQRAIKSWLDAGFSVSSLNTPDEIEALQNHFPYVNFVPVLPVADSQCLKLNVSFDDILNYLEKNGPRICGIVEPDIFLHGTNLASRIAKEACNCLVYQQRIDIQTLEAHEGLAFPGLGCVFFDRELIRYYPKEKFCMGEPWWDYWAILIPILYKIPVKKISTPFAYHTIHPEQYDLERLLKLGEIITKYTSSPFNLSIETIAKLQYILLHLLNSHSLEVALHELPSHAAPTTSSCRNGAI